MKLNCRIRRYVWLYAVNGKVVAAYRDGFDKFKEQFPTSWEIMKSNGIRQDARGKFYYRPSWKLYKDFRPMWAPVGETLRRLVCE